MLLQADFLLRSKRSMGGKYKQNNSTGFLLRGKRSMGGKYKQNNSTGFLLR
jgi:hypothetical protein